MTTSAAGLYGNFGQTNYTAAKMALIGLMNTLKLEGQKYNIKVNTVAPVAASRLTEDVLPPDFFEKLKPEFVAPMVLYLSSEECPVTGNIYNAGMGCYNRAAIVTGPGTVIGKGQDIPTPEQVVDAWEDIASLKNAKEYTQLNEQIGDLLAAFTPKKTETVEPAATDGGSVADVFNAMADTFNADAAEGVDIIFQFCISGKDGGDWACIIKDKTCTIDVGMNEQAVCTLKMEDNDFLDMMTGKLPAMQAYTSGKLQIEGDIMKSQLIEKLFKI
jgi:putative sterol carrier protein